MRDTINAIKPNKAAHFNTFCWQSDNYNHLFLIWEKVDLKGSNAAKHPLRQRSPRARHKLPAASSTMHLMTVMMTAAVRKKLQSDLRRRPRMSNMWVVVEEKEQKEVQEDSVIDSDGNPVEQGDQLVTSIYLSAEVLSHLPSLDSHPYCRLYGKPPATLFILTLQLAVSTKEHHTRREDLKTDSDDCSPSYFLQVGNQLCLT